MQDWDVSLAAITWSFWFNKEGGEIVGAKVKKRLVLHHFFFYNGKFE